MASIQYFEPTSIEEAVSLLTQYKEEAKIVAGGTDLVVDMNKYLINPKYLVSINSIPNLDYIKFEQGQGVEIGATTTVAALQESSELKEKYPMIHQAACQFANMAVRNMATLGGNLCNAAPSADMAPGLIAIVLGAKAKIAGPNGERIIPLEEFFVGVNKTALQTGEILVAIQVPELPNNTKCVYYKYAVKSKSDLPVVGVAVAATIEPKEKIFQDIKIALSNVAPTPMRARNAEDLLKGKKIDEALIDKCAQAAADEANPRPGSIRASAEYKKAMVKVYTKKALMEFIS